ncbi:MAG: hypothetical protein IJ009_03660 [Clostridia bacterium]|nr:hypothetical protein [Clostridia bacterium]
MQDTLIPVLLGADLNCYGMARAFYEAYGIRSVAFGKQVLGATRYSRYLTFRHVPQLSDSTICREVLLDFAKTNKDKTCLLLACTDEYVRFLIENKATLEPYFVVPVPSEDSLPLMEKDAFYRLCAEHSIPYPETVVYREMPTLSEILATGKRLGYPHIIKPAQSDLYWNHPFRGMEKVYLVHNKHEEECILSLIYGAGYTGAVLAQRYIGGDRSRAFVLTLYLDREGKVALRACGRVLLEEQTPCGKGNYAALVTAPIPRVAASLAEMLSRLGYRGFANFDIRRDVRGHDYVLEVNLRQGRSNYFLTAAGTNPTILLARDCILCEALGETDAKKSVLFRTVPLSVVCRYTARDRDAILAKSLHRKGCDVSLLHAPSDLFANPLRTLYVWEHMRREKQKFRRYAEPKR